ncbi:MAG: hypothetical protein Q8Q10_00440 [bacterium]|nr:hypothetical protein [bacterium]
MVKILGIAMAGSSIFVYLAKNGWRLTKDRPGKLDDKCSYIFLFGLALAVLG